MTFAMIAGDRPWHNYLLERVLRHVGTPECLVRIHFGPQGAPPPPVGLPPEDAINWRRHFGNREDASRWFFGPPKPAPYEHQIVPLGDEATIDYAALSRSPLVLIFGCGLVDPRQFGPQTRVVNIHLGLSPRYRGGACLFWPFYFLEPCWAGATLHQIDATSDTGPIVHQVVPPMERQDNLQDVAAKTVVAMADALVELLPKWESWTYHPQTATGKQFLGRDFRPEHLRPVYSYYNDDLVRYHLDGELTCTPPTLVTQKGL